MVTKQSQRLGIFLALALVMAATRMHHFEGHFDRLPDASWAVFFLAGFWLRGSVRWAFPILMALAVALDYLAIRNLGLSFWDHYCVSVAYWFLVPSYFALWMGGSWLSRHYAGLTLKTLAFGAAALLVSEGVCYLLSNGSFYWLSDSVPAPRSFGAWFKNLGDWYMTFLVGTAAYAAVGAVLHVVVTQLARVLGHAGEQGLRR
ncbi:MULTISPECIES: hypothetical protein [Dyella]|uniref:Cobalamin ABC transporter n=2 Tax=Dyella TaxID=231454 RepID=A0A4R0YN55_9GAMM|nr:MULTISPECIES: hypothetical protein [Dyella]TBR36999.1 hypothetical protein EYV96_13980 [Dyella terrae]TCI07911.1 hypothetical protein EZM97_24890 [Dyella soli]